MSEKTYIGVFDSGYGGLTVFKEIRKLLPQYDYIYLGDNARTPYGTRSFEIVYKYTLQCVKKLFELNCHLVILACNTASAKALRTIQQKDLPQIAPDKRVLGVIRPTTEVIGNFSTTKHVGILATQGTVQSQSYEIEIKKFFPDVVVYQEACPMWVPLVEYNEHLSDGADYFVKKHIHHILSQSPQIDILLLACTHYPLLLPKIQKYTPPNVQILSQGPIVAQSLEKYLKRHQEIDQMLTKNGSVQFYTTNDSDVFSSQAQIFWGEPIDAKKIEVM